MTIRELINSTDLRTKLIVLAGGVQIDLDTKVEAMGADQGAIVISAADNYIPKHLPKWQYAKPGTHPADVEVRA